VMFECCEPTVMLSRVILSCAIICAGKMHYSMQLSYHSTAYKVQGWIKVAEATEKCVVHGEHEVWGQSPGQNLGV